MNPLHKCTLCPRNCKVNRLKDSLGFCNVGKNIRLAKAYLHKWEEPCISGENGSGTIFFSNCNLNCVFCQNHEISQKNYGKEISINRLSDIFIEQQNKGAHNINLVSPTPYVPQIIEAIKLSKCKGLSIPIIYNTNSYENIETIKLLKGYIDVYLPDIKYFDDKYAIKYSNAKNYFKHASSAVKEMFSQVGNPVFKNGLIKKGIIIRHLMLPGLLFDSKKIIDYIYKTFGNSVYISIMNQYTPTYNSKYYKEINKKLNINHYNSLINYAISIGVTNGFIQENGTCSENFIPNFDLEGI
ncbi:radical SAM superfamily protein [Clostridium acetireducens DSM 10703]|jgi:putative pyruvate formate lyase activating enzyme|uniref:Radical SAM superfamily protein n=1 Tax=Clostridium acetireducens DSM 10703 TaxID=1121290 RepID=A0A1E8EZY7_9CLOT|nr:radical SAM protein [Clostridium acetireducens]OFI06592.1 radical SAM superfamily protein [Clostridium acetireducens DSM 10703]